MGEGMTRVMDPGSRRVRSLQDAGSLPGAWTLPESLSTIHRRELHGPGRQPASPIHAPPGTPPTRFPSVGAPPDWPQFLGPDRTGVVTDTDWAASGAAEPLWKRNVGLGYSCPSVVAGRLVTMGFDAEAEQDVVLCLAPDTGEELWRHAYDATDDPRYHGGGTLTTPTIAGAVVYTVNRHGHTFALELETGEPVWERDYREELDLPSTFHGYCSSPVVLEDRIVYVFGGVVIAAEREGGDVIWRSTDHGDGAYTNPTVFELRGRTLVAVMLGQTLFVLDLDDGTVVHRLDWPLQGSAVHVAQPLAIGDRLLISTAYGKGAGMLRLGDSVEPDVLWTSRRMRNKVTGLYLHDGHVYGFDESMLKCLDLDGNEMWRVRGLGMGALSIAGDRLLVLSSRGELVGRRGHPRGVPRELTTRGPRGGLVLDHARPLARPRLRQEQPWRPRLSRSSERAGGRLRRHLRRPPGPRPPPDSSKPTPTRPAPRRSATHPVFGCRATGRSWAAGCRARRPRSCSGRRTAGASDSTPACSSTRSTASSDGS